MRNGSFVHRHLNQIFLGSFYALCDCSSHFTSLTQAVTYNAISITDYDNGCERKSTTTFRYFRDAVNGYQFIF